LSANYLQKLARSRTTGNPLGIYSVCSAHPLVIKAAVKQAIHDDSVLLLEATCNQVNQFGGYTGMRCTDFVSLVNGIASSMGMRREQLILGGDHLGPNPWRDLPADVAMRNAEEMVVGYVEAGFTKIHLDTSMACAGDETPLPERTIAERAAQLCVASEGRGQTDEICYIIGTEVPIPGGATESLQQIETTRPENVRRTLEVHREAFKKAGLSRVWSRVIGMVVQPGLEFNHDSVADYMPEKTRDLQRILHNEPSLVYEAHSTDYQHPSSYRDLVCDGFAILKVGPALTFAMREALFALSCIEEELITPENCSMLRAVVEDAMMRQPASWRTHYHGDVHTQMFLRRYSYSDRIRYYWGDPSVQRAVSILLRNLDAVGIPETVLSQYLPAQYEAVRCRQIASTAEAIILHKIQQVLEPYARGCGSHVAVA